MQLEQLSAAAALRQGCATYKVLDGVSETAPGQAYIKIVVHTLKHRTISASLNALLYVKPTKEDENTPEPRATATKVVTGFLEDVANGVNMLRVYTSHPAFAAMARFEYFVVAKPFLRKAMNVMLDFDVDEDAPGKRGRVADTPSTPAERAAQAKEKAVLDVLHAALVENETVCQQLWAGVREPTAAANKGQYLRMLREQGLRNVPGSFAVPKKDKPAVRHIANAYLVDELRQSMDLFFDSERVVREITKTAKAQAKKDDIAARDVCHALYERMARQLGDGGIGEGEGDEESDDESDGESDEEEEEAGDEEAGAEGEGEVGAEGESEGEGARAAGPVRCDSTQRHD